MSVDGLAGPRTPQDDDADVRKKPGARERREPRATSRVTAVVEMGGIEPPSIAFELRLLRAQSVKTFCSAPTFSTDT